MPFLFHALGVAHDSHMLDCKKGTLVLRQPESVGNGIHEEWYVRRVKSPQGKNNDHAGYSHKAKERIQLFVGCFIIYVQPKKLTEGHTHNKGNHIQNDITYSEHTRVSIEKRRNKGHAPYARHKAGRYQAAFRYRRFFGIE